MLGTLEWAAAEGVVEDEYNTDHHSPGDQLLLGEMARRRLRAERQAKDEGTAWPPLLEDDDLPF
jgi:hypothetical protein